MTDIGLLETTKLQKINTIFYLRLQLINDINVWGNAPVKLKTIPQSKPRLHFRMVNVDISQNLRSY